MVQSLCGRRQKQEIGIQPGYSPENEEITVIQQICRNGWKKQVCAQLRILEGAKNPTG